MLFNGYSWFIVFKTIANEIASQYTKLQYFQNIFVT
jgi:hypothetical protein